MRREDSGDIDMPLAAEGDRETSLPFVEVGNNCRSELSGNVLWRAISKLTRTKNSSLPLRGTTRRCSQR